jgi:hypothetical protein
MACHSFGKLRTGLRSEATLYPVPCTVVQDSAKNLVFVKQRSAMQTTRFFASAEFILNEVKGFGSE